MLKVCITHKFPAKHSLLAADLGCCIDVFTCNGQNKAINIARILSTFISGAMADKTLRQHCFILHDAWASIDARLQCWLLRNEAMAVLQQALLNTTHVQFSAVYSTYKPVQGEICDASSLKYL